MPASSEQHEAAGSSPEPHKNASGPPDRQTLRELYLAFRGLASGAELSETIEGIRIAAAGHIVGLNRFGIGGGVATPDGKLRAHLALDVDGISSADIPEDAREYVPHHFAFKPSISGISLADLDALIMAATAPESEKPDLDKRISAMFAHGGIAVGIETLALDLGPADLSGSGKLTALAPDNMRGEAEVKATGFDALIANALQRPTLAKAVPVLAIMRSLARQEGQDLLWSVRMENNVVTVNGHDLAAMFGKEQAH